MTDQPSVRDNTAERRFEVVVDDARAVLTYRRTGDRLVLVHTEVPDAVDGRGIGGALVRAAVARAEEQGLTVVPRCPFARGWLERHPDVAGRVTIDWPAPAG
jgi:predicted GNAT family acetyltransferase